MPSATGAGTSWCYQAVRRHAQAARVALFALIAGAAVAMMILSWRRWGDPQIDFGVQLYLPWRVLQGEHLARDYVHPYGPLSTYFNAGLFKLFGTGITTLVAANIFIYAAMTWLLWRALRTAFGLLPASVAILMSVPVFGFSHLTGINNYNYISPYAHEATHGMFLLVLLLAWLLRPVVLARGREGLIAGVLFGLVCLTKVEIVVAAAGVMGVAALRELVERRPDAIRWMRAACAGAVAILAVTWAGFAAVIGARAATKAVASGILSPLLYPGYAVSTNTLRFLGADRPLANLSELVVMGAAAGAGLLCMAWIGAMLSRWSKVGNWIAVPLAVPVALALSLGLTNNFAKAEPGLLLIGGGLTARRVWRAWRHRQTLPLRTFANGIILVAALLLMARMLLAPKIEHYGFYQLILSTIWLCAFYAAEWPLVAATTRVSRRFLGAVILCWTLLFGIMAARVSSMLYATMTQPVGTGRDRTLGYGAQYMKKYQIFEQTRAFLAPRLQPSSTLLVLPEGIGLNYLLRAKHPLPITNALGPTLGLNGAAVTTVLRAHPPDFVVLMTRPAVDDIYPLFGRNAESGRPILEWLQQDYQVIGTAGDDPFNDERPEAFGVWVLQRKSKAPRVGDAGTVLRPQLPPT